MSSLFNQASLVVEPAVYENGKVYATKPFDGTGDLTFTRASNATRVASNGLIEKVRTNLLLQSQTFQTTWTAVRSSISADTTTAPDGTNTADTLFDSVDNNLHYVAQNFSALTGPATISIYAKANQLSQIQLVAAGGTTAMGRGFDLSAGTTFGESVGAVVSNDLGESITAVGNGWYRCTMSWTATGQTAFWILTSVGNAATYLGTGTDGVYIWGAQLETGDIATDYIATTSAAVSVGPVSGLPRLDYLNSSCPRLLLEPSRTSYVLFSEQINNAAWSTLNASITSNTTTSPDGYANADKLGGSVGTADQVYVGQSLSLPSAGTYTYSFFAKASDKSWVRLRTLGFDAGGNVQTWFNLADGTIGTDGSGNAKIVSYGNGWYRCSYSFTTTTDLIGSVYAYLADANNGLAVNRDGTGIFLWGAMLELGAYATSYIGPTLSTSVTRVADAASKTGISSLIGQTEGTIFADIIKSQSGYNYYSISDGTNANWIFIGLDADAANRIRGYVRAANVVTADINSGAIANGRVKMAIAYKTNDVVVYINGTQIGTDTSAAMPTGLANFYLTNNAAATSVTNSVNQTLLFKTRLTNAQLAELTTL